MTIEDPIALRRPAPEISIEEDYGEPEQPLPVPSGPSGTFVTTLAVLPNQGDRHIVVEEAQKYIIGQWVAVNLQAGHFISRIRTTADSPSFTIPFTTGFTGTVNAGAQVWIFD